jgi:outer membrane lipoprotein-sorting protein
MSSVQMGYSMRACLIKFVAVGILLAGSSWAAAQDNPKAILDKAVKAMGGAEKLSKTKAQEIKSKGTLEVQGLSLEFTEDSSVQHPSKFKESMHLSVMGKQIDVITVFNGKEGWISAGGETKALEGPALEAVKDGLDTALLTRMAFTGGKDYDLTALGESKVNDRPVLGVKISRKGHKDVNLYFDKGTGLLAKLEHQVKDAMGGQDVSEERIVLEYQDVDGMKVGKKMNVLRDGKKFMDIEITEVKFPDKIDESMVDKP